MNFLEIVSEVENDSSFSLPNSTYLVHGFRIYSSTEPEEWQIGYYNPETDKITSFTYKDKTVTKNPPSGVFKESGTVAPLIKRDVVLSFEEALKLATEAFNRSYSQHPVMKTIMLLQNIPVGQVFNVTIVTQTFNMYNVKLDSKDGKIYTERFDSIMTLKKE